MTERLMLFSEGSENFTSPIVACDRMFTTGSLDFPLVTGKDRLAYERERERERKNHRYQELQQITGSCFVTKDGWWSLLKPFANLEGQKKD
ncbi:hypothetical protein NC653_011047 [Populus alba x Populus x berolinensis]|uniref:Uncharacterized protein n=1 Tax=Populus alba x Populus x berolinensis TaxID=444605 RepID=A0AAD6R155_9ROSI|nr:hypothetical protein NC653_011047 [Populus alba x Populus x berolinensis]